MIRQIVTVPKGIALDCFYIMNQFVDVDGTILTHMCDSVDNGRALMFIDERPNGFITGFITGYIACDVAHVQNLYVDKACQRCGIGGALLVAYQNYCVKKGIQQMALTSRLTRQSINFYEKNGFVRIAVNKLVKKSL